MASAPVKEGRSPGALVRALPYGQAGSKIMSVEPGVDHEDHRQGRASSLASSSARSGWGTVAGWDASGWRTGGQSHARDRRSDRRGQNHARGQRSVRVSPWGYRRHNELDYGGVGPDLKRLFLRRGMWQNSCGADGRCVRAMARSERRQLRRPRRKKTGGNVLQLFLDWSSQ